MSVTRPTCTELPAAPRLLSVRLPGGATIQLRIGGEVGLSDLSVLSPGLAVWQPVFIMMDTVIAIKDTFKATPGLIRADVDPFRDALARVVSGVGKLAGMMPQLSIPVLIRDVVALLVAVLGVVESMLDDILAIEAEAQAVIDGAASAPAAYAADMITQGECLQAQAAKMLDTTLAEMGPMTGLLNILTVLGSLANIPGMPTLGDMTGQSTQQVKDAIGTLVTALEALPL